MGTKLDKLVTFIWVLAIIALLTAVNRHQAWQQATAAFQPPAPIKNTTDTPTPTPSPTPLPLTPTPIPSTPTGLIHDLCPTQWQEENQPTTFACYQTNPLYTTGESSFFTEPSLFIDETTPTLLTITAIKNEPNQSQAWSVGFKAAGDALLETGQFTATGFTNPTAGTAKFYLSTSTDNTCTYPSGSFKVHELHRDATGEIDRLAIDLFYNCLAPKDQPAILGFIRFHSTIPVTNQITQSQE